MQKKSGSVTLLSVLARRRRGPPTLALRRDKEKSEIYLEKAFDVFRGNGFCDFLLRQPCFATATQGRRATKNRSRIMTERGGSGKI